MAQMESILATDAQINNLSGPWSCSGTRSGCSVPVRSGDCHRRVGVPQFAQQSTGGGLGQLFFCEDKDRSVPWDQVPTSQWWPHPRRAVAREQRWHPLQATGVSCSSALKEPRENRKKKYLVDPLSMSSEGDRSLQVRFPSGRLGAKQKGVAGWGECMGSIVPQPLYLLGPAARGGAPGSDTPAALPPQQLCLAMATLLQSCPMSATQPRAHMGCWSQPGHLPTSGPSALTTHCWYFQVN